MDTTIRLLSQEPLAGRLPTAAMLELVPHAELVDVAGAGHMVAGDRNDRFNTAVVDFLEQTVRPRLA